MMSQLLPSSGSDVPPPRHHLLAQMLFIALAYPLTGYLGLLLAIPPGYATAVWPPSGIALAAVLLWGRRVWPGIWAGSLVLNVWISLNGPFGLNSTNFIFCLAAATGATLQALAGDGLSRSSKNNGTLALDTLGSVVRFVLLGGLASCLIASTNAVVALYALGMIDAAQVFNTFWTWWIGDAIGVMIFTPLVLICFGQPRPLWASRRFSVGLPLAVSFTTVVALFVWNSARERSRIQSEFETLSTTLDQSFRNQLFNSAESLASLRDVTSVCEPLSHSQFSHFAGTFLKRNPSAAALAWVERVPHDQRAAFESAIAPITEKSGDGPRIVSKESFEYYPIRYSEPSPANAAAVGLNLIAEPNRRDCLLRAAQSGELAVSRRIQLIQDISPQPSIQLALPVYKNGVNLGSEESRRTHLRGFVTTVLRINHFMAGAMPLADLSVMVELQDVSNAAQPQTLFHHNRDAFAQGDSNPLFSYVNAVSIGGRTWQLRVQPTPAFLSAHGSSSAWGILAGGLILVSLLGAFLLVLTGRTAKVQELVAEKTQSLEMQMAELVRAEAAVAASEKRFRSYFDLGQVGIAITSPTKGWVEVNEKLLKDFGYTREELGKLTWADVTHPEDLGADVALFNRVLSGEINGYDMDKRYIRKNGTLLHAAMSVGCTRKEDGSIDYFIAMIQDISERQRVRDALLQAKDSAEAASRAKGDFLATMSHEIRTPMNGVIGFTELLLETPLNAEQRDYIKAIKNSGHVLLSLINDILDFSKIEAGKMEMETADFDIEAVLLEVCNLLRAQSQDKGLSLSVDIEPDARKMVQADPLRTRQVLLNLLGNAIKFTKVGGVTLRVSKAMVGSGGKSVVRISVQDTGIGIPCDKQAQLFQKFTQADSSTTRQFGGTGLGLAICKRLVELMGGEIGLQSRPGHGSVFWFTIPLVETPSAKRSSSSIRRPSLSIIDPAQLDGLFCKVLLAEDNAINQTLARKMLEKLGCRVDLAVNGLEAYKKLCAKKYDVVFMDCHMPEMDGYTATREIRRWESEHPERPSTPIVALTANAFQGDEDECRAAGMDDFLTKPVTKDAMKKALDRWIKLVTAPEKAQ